MRIIAPGKMTWGPGTRVRLIKPIGPLSEGQSLVVVDLFPSDRYLVQVPGSDNAYIMIPPGYLVQDDSVEAEYPWPI